MVAGGDPLRKQWQQGRRLKLGAAIALMVAIGLVSATGCGGGGRTAKVSGKVMADGKAVTGGSISIAPVASGPEDKSVGGGTSAAIGSDGSFTTNTPISAGKAKVTFIDPGGQYPPGYTPKPSEPPPPSPYQGMVVKDPEVEIKPGTPLTIELVKKR